jgi:hypothetical protein
MRATGGASPTLMYYLPISVCVPSWLLILTPRLLSYQVVEAWRDVPHLCAKLSVLARTACRIANSSDLFLVMTPPLLRMEITHSRGEEGFGLPRRWVLQKLVLSAFMAHWTAASNIGRGSYERKLCQEYPNGSNDTATNR